uniref:Uncharacterized protein n=1 Tax=Anopheles dirus TaxID=7168 RepID=A0A182N0I6_9DIPT
MPDNTGRVARMKKDDSVSSSSGADEKKKIVDLLSSLVQNLSINREEVKNMGFLVPPVGDQPAKFVRLEDVERSLEDMALLHEIAVNDEFAVGQAREDAGDLYGRVEAQMHNAYWDVLRMELAKEPPGFTMVFALLTDIKDAFESLLAGNNDRSLATIRHVLDPGMLRQMADEDGLGVLNYTTKFLLEIMGMACSPARDAEIAALKQEAEPIARLRGVMETLDRMKCDMANYTLRAQRGEVLRYAVEYEKQRFAEVQAVCTQEFPATVAWLRRNCTPAGDERFIRLMDGKVQMPEQLFDAYAELLDPECADPFPELLGLDQRRLQQLKEEAQQLCVCATVMQLTCASVQALATDKPARGELAHALQILCKDFPRKGTLADTLQSLALQALVTVDAFVARHPDAAPAATEQSRQALEAQIADVAGRRRSGVYGVVWRKLIAHARNLLLVDRPEQVTSPPSYADYRADLNRVCWLFKRVVTYNYAVHGDFYQQWLKQF